MSKSTDCVASLRDVYVPRHIRLRGGSYEDPVPHVAMREITELVPLLSDSGAVVAEKAVVTLKPAHECMAVYKRADFLIDNLLAAGVPLSEVNFELCSRTVNDVLVVKAINLGLLSEEFSSYVVPSVESSKENVENE